MIGGPVKTCRKCGEDKPLEDFHKHPTAKQGRNPRCKLCVKEYTREHYAKNADTYRENTRKWRAKNKQRFRDSNRARHLMSRYGLTIDDYMRMQIRQCNVCVVCRDWLGDGQIAVDHCHETGRVRGLLHSTCNAAIGLLKDDPTILENAAIYLRSY